SSSSRPSHRSSQLAPWPSRLGFSGLVTDAAEVWRCAALAASLISPDNQWSRHIELSPRGVQGNIQVSPASRTPTVTNTMPEQPAARSAVLERVRAGQPVLTLGVRGARTADIVRLAKSAGYGVVWVDLEHSSMSIDCAAQILASAGDLGLEAWVRVPERD